MTTITELPELKYEIYDDGRILPIHVPGFVILHTHNFKCVEWDLESGESCINGYLRSYRDVYYVISGPFSRMVFQYAGSTEALREFNDMFKKSMERAKV